MALVKCLTCKGRGFLVIKGKTVECQAKCKNGWVEKRLL